MATFDKAIDYVLVNECGPNFDDSCHPDNDGGLVKFGLNAKANPDLLIKYGSNLERLDLVATRFEYEDRYWLPIMSQLVSQRAATKILDMRVSQGQTDAINHLQKVVGIEHVTGYFGPTTLAKANAMDENKLLKGLVSEAVIHYLTTEEKHPEYKKYDHNWIVRAHKLPV